MKTFLKFIKAEGSGIERAKSTVEILQEVLGLLKGQYWNYWTTHWQAKGENYYGNHLLFQRIYEGMQGEIDTLAEKIVGYFDENFGKYGMEHVDWSHRVSMSKIQPAGYHDVDGSELFFKICNHESAVTN